MITSPSLAALHGYLCSDGCVIKNPPHSKHIYHYIDLRNTEIVLLKDFQEHFKEYFGETPRIGNDRCKKSSKKIYWKLIKRFGSFHCKDWRVPEMTRDCSALWLRAAFDCEAWVTNRPRQDRSIGFDSANFVGLKQIQTLLSDNFTIQSKLFPKPRRDIQRLMIYGKENLLRFQQHINFLHPGKKQKLQEALDSYDYWKWDFSKVSIEEILREKVKRKKHVLRIFSRKENLLRLQVELEKQLGIHSKISERINGQGTIYYELSIYGAEQIERIENLIRT